MPALTEALRYAGQGHAVLPCIAGTKEPAATGGVYSATTDVDQLEQWWRWWPDANVAVAARPSELVFADLDRRANHDGVANFGRLLESLELDWPTTRTTATPSDSRHLWVHPSCRPGPGRPHPRPRRCPDRPGLRPGPVLDRGRSAVPVRARRRTDRAASTASQALPTARVQRETRSSPGGRDPRPGRSPGPRARPAADRPRRRRGTQRDPQPCRLLARRVRRRRPTPPSGRRGRAHRRRTHSRPRTRRDRSHHRIRSHSRRDSPLTPRAPHRSASKSTSHLTRSER
jgi:hypothetical protein